jgi:hypothetical protein
MHVLVRNPGQTVGFFTTRAAARRDQQASCTTLCQAVFTVSHESALKLLKRKRIERGIHAVYFHIEPRMRRLP